MCDVNQSNITADGWRCQGNYKKIIGKTFRGKVTNESAIKPEYTGTGKLVLEPTYKHILLIDVKDWNDSIVIEDGLFLACESNLKHKAVMRSNLSSARFFQLGDFW